MLGARKARLDSSLIPRTRRKVRRDETGSLMSALANIPSDLNRERLLGTDQTAEFLGMSVPHLRRLYRAKKIPDPIRIGERKYGWRLGQLIEFVASKAEARS